MREQQFESRFGGNAGENALAVATDAGQLIFIYGYSMAVSPFDRLRGGRSGIVEECGYGITKLLSLKT